MLHRKIIFDDERMIPAIPLISTEEEIRAHLRTLRSCIKNTDYTYAHELYFEFSLDEQRMMIQLYESHCMAEIDTLLNNTLRTFEKEKIQAILNDILYIEERTLMDAFMAEDLIEQLPSEQLHNALCQDHLKRPYKDFLEIFPDIDRNTFLAILVKARECYTFWAEYFYHRKGVRSLSMSEIAVFNTTTFGMLGTKIKNYLEASNAEPH